MLAWSGAPLDAVSRQKLRLGGTYGSSSGNEYYGPLTKAVTIGGETSLYRWHVANDWRLWQKETLDGLGMQSRLVQAKLAPAEADTRLVHLGELMERGRAHLNIRFLVSLSKGKRLHL